MSQSLLGLAVIAAAVVAVVTAAAGGILLADVHAQDAADAAALAAAHATRTAAAATVAAGAAAARHGATVVSCRCDGPVVEVRVRVAVPVRAARLAGVRSREAVAAARLLEPVTQAG